MTRNEAIAIITAKLQTTLETADDTTLAAAAEHLSKPSGLTVGDVLEAFPTESVLPRPLTVRERSLIEQSRQDFSQGRSYSLDEAEALLDAAAEKRAAACNA